MNWDKQSARDRMHRVGTEGAKQNPSMMTPLLRGPRPWNAPASKAELRAMLAQAVANTVALKITKLPPQRQ